MTPHQGFDIAAGFRTAAQLVHLKSQKTLPRTPRPEMEQGEELDPQAGSAATGLREHWKKFLHNWESENCFSVTHASQRTCESGAMRVCDYRRRPAGSLFRDIVKKQFAPPHEIYVEHITIGERIAEISSTLNSKTGQLRGAGPVVTREK